MRYVVLTALGDDRTGIVNDLSDEILRDGGNIEDSRMAVLGGSFAVIMMVSADTDAIDRLVSGVSRIESKLGLSIAVKTTEPRRQNHDLAPYRIDVVAMDHPGIVHQVADYFASRQINIEDLSTATYAAAHTGTPMFSMHITVSLDANHMSELKHEFQEFCDHMNLDATIEPVTSLI